MPGLNEWQCVAAVVTAKRPKLDDDDFAVETRQC